MPAARAEPPLRVAVLGASGFGRYHVRELAAAGADVIGILGSSAASASACAERLATEFGVRPRAHHALEDVLAERPDLVVVSTPHELHLEQTLAALRSGAFVLCEKPLFWSPDLRPDVAADALEQLASAGATERLAINLLNVALVDDLRAAGWCPVRPERLSLSFHTQGLHRGRDVAVDLLPHALSLLDRLLPGAGATGAVGAAGSVLPNGVDLAFDWGGCAVALELREDPAGAKRLELELDDRRCRREAGVTGGRYRSWLILESGGVLQLEDPLRRSVRAALAAATGRGPALVDFAAARRNQEALVALMAELPKAGAPPSDSGALAADVN